MGDERKDSLESLQSVVSALETQYPKFMKQLRAEYSPQAESEVDVAKRFSPEYLKLQADLMSSADMDKLAAAGRKLSAADQMSAAETEAEIARTAGADQVRTADKLQREIDPEYYTSRGEIAQALTKAFGSIDPNKLTKGEEEQIARGLGRTAWAGGGAAPMETIKSAMTFGDALARRRGEYRDTINMAAGANPVLRSGIPAADIASRRIVTPNVGVAQFTGIQTPGINTANQMAGTMLSGTTALQQGFNQQAKTWMDKFRAVTGGIGDLAGAYTGMKSAGRG